MSRPCGDNDKHGLCLTLASKTGRSEDEHQMECTHYGSRGCGRSSRFHFSPTSQRANLFLKCSSVLD